MEMEEAESTIHASHLIQDPKSGMICIEYSNKVKKKKMFQQNGQCCMLDPIHLQLSISHVQLGRLPWKREKLNPLI